MIISNLTVFVSNEYWSPRVGYLIVYVNVTWLLVKLDNCLCECYMIIVNCVGFCDMNIWSPRVG
jgi:hypothetical protein